mgnify:CR=1 FL=1
MNDWRWCLGDEGFEVVLLGVHDRSGVIPDVNYWMVGAVVETDERKDSVEIMTVGCVRG